ncbi:MAG: hypothetical protein H0X26_07230 [Alphaproteobacteria bacterium]|nr:hypothetical protein [Alphaproteobacteria bacterium]
MKGKWNVYPEMGAAGLWTTSTDLANFILSLQGILAGKPGILNLSLVKEMITPQIENAGLGVYVSGKGKDLRFMHSGQNIGFLSQFDAYPFLGQGMVIMVNDDTSRGLIDEIERSIADVYKMPGFEPIKKKISPIDPSLYKNFTGVFKTEGQEIEIKLVNNKLFFHNKLEPTLKFELYPEKENTFFVKENGLIFNFTGPQKNFDTLTVTGSNISKFIFKKVPADD